MHGLLLWTLMVAVTVVGPVPVQHGFTLPEAGDWDSMYVSQIPSASSGSVTGESIDVAISSNRTAIAWGSGDGLVVQYVNADGVATIQVDSRPTGQASAYFMPDGALLVAALQGAGDALELHAYTIREGQSPVEFSPKDLGGVSNFMATSLSPQGRFAVFLSELCQDCAGSAVAGSGDFRPVALLYDGAQWTRVDGPKLALARGASFLDEELVVSFTDLRDLDSVFLALVRNSEWRDHGSFRYAERGPCVLETLVPTHQGPLIVVPLTNLVLKQFERVPGGNALTDCHVVSAFGRDPNTNEWKETNLQNVSLDSGFRTMSEDAWTSTPCGPIIPYRAYQGSGIRLLAIDANQSQQVDLARSGSRVDSAALGSLGCIPFLAVRGMVSGPNGTAEIHILFPKGASLPMPANESPTPGPDTPAGKTASLGLLGTLLAVGLMVGYSRRARRR
jgi:hypothetical protein